MSNFARRFEPFEPHLIKQKKTGGRTIDFVEWTQYIVRAHQTDFPEGFSVEVRMVKEIGGSAVVVMRVIDNATGAFMDATGMADAKKEKANWGGAMAEAESQALRRAFAKHGMGLDMYFDEDEREEIREENRPAPAGPRDGQIQMMKTLMWVLEEAMTVDDPIAEEAKKIREGTNTYVKKNGVTEEVLDKLLPQVRAKMRECGILPVNDISFANAIDALDLEPANPAAQALIDEEKSNG